MATELTRTSAYESNPFRADLPPGIREISEELATFLRELVQTLRETHNGNQAGDSTFPWEDLTDLSNTPFYTPGSLGRFVHPVHGVIFARYVKFTHATDADDLATGAVCGFTNLKGSFEWGVTPRLNQSRQDAVVGVLAAYEQPKKNQYGWVIVLGPNIRSLKLIHLSRPVLGQRFTWRDSETLESSSYNTVVGTLISSEGVTQGNSSIWTLPPGSVRVDVWQQAPEVAVPGIDETLILSSDQLNQLVEAVGALLNLDTLSANLITAERTIKILEDGLSTEQATRLNADNDFRAALNEVIDAKNVLEVALSELTLTVSANRTQIEAALALAVSNLNLQITAANERINAVEDTNNTQNTDISNVLAQMVNPGADSLPTLASPWVNASGYAPLVWRKSPNGIVSFNGVVSAPSGSTTLVLFSLPAEASPAVKHEFLVATSAGNCRVTIDSSGDVTLTGASLTWTSLDGISFRAA